MSQYVLEYADGRTEEIVASNDSDAEAAAMARFDTAAVMCDSWDDDGVNDDGDPMRRKLIWLSEADAQDDDGASAVAELTAMGRA